MATFTAFLDVPLHSKQKLDLLNDIDELRSLGISEHIDLPQLIVCGDQSSGKSSVLEAISRISFPTKDNLCTRFATEVILRQQARESINVAILPNRDRPAGEIQRLEEFQHKLSAFSDFGALVEAAHKMMVEAGGEPQTFYKDILRLEISGPDQPHLTIVDLPGLIHSGSKHQSTDDVKTVRRMVRAYMKKPRSIILAVVSAKNDIANQVVLDLVRQVDQYGSRTLGIITKPDELRAGSESQRDFIELAKNENTKLRLGWHVLRNRDYDERNASSKERDDLERDFFERDEWSNLPRDIVGIRTLKPKLSDVLFEHIKSQLPNVVEDLERSIRGCERVLAQLGPSRDTLPEQRVYLLEVAQDFQKIVDYGVNGIYDDDFFGDPDHIGATKRLRALIQNLNAAYAEDMRLRGHEREIVERNVKTVEDDENARPKISRSDFVDEIKELLKIDRGRELPGTYNPLLVARIFLTHSRPWGDIAVEHLNKVWEAAMTFLGAAADHVFPNSAREHLQELIIDPGMGERRAKMSEKLEEILWPYQNCHPITYNHYLTETIQKMRNQRNQEDVKRILKGKRWETDGYDRVSVTISEIAAALSRETEADMDRYACMELLDCMQAFYKVAIKSVVDNVSIYAVEMSLVKDLQQLFDPAMVGGMTDEMVRKMASETAHDQQLRKQQEQKVKIFRRGLAKCRLHAVRKVDGETIRRIQWPKLTYVADDDDDVSEAESTPSRPDTPSQDGGANDVSGAPSEHSVFPQEQVQPVLEEPEIAPEDQDGLGPSLSSIRKTKKKKSKKDVGRPTEEFSPYSWA